MIGLDTNVLVRYIVHDDTAQATAATRLIESCTEESPGFVSQLVITELFWVLSRGYEYEKAVICQVLSKMLSSAELDVEDAAEVWLALRAYESGSADLADYLIGRKSLLAGCETTFTFDKAAAKSGLHTLVP